MVKNKEIIDFTIGTDVELILVNPKTGRIVHAADYFNSNSPFGADSNGRTAEIRSKPSKCPLEAVRSIKTYMQDAVNGCPQSFSWKWLGGSFVKGYPIGFHAHAGLKNYNYKTLLPVLNNYVGAISLLLEPKKEGVSRRLYNKTPGGNACEYGRMSDVREKKHGFEFRSASSCISSPYTLASMLCLFKAVIYEQINNASFRPAEFIEAEDFVTVNQAKVRRFFPQIWQDITKLTLYPRYKKQLDLIKYLVDNNKTWQQGKGEIKTNWGIKDFSKFLKSVSPPEIKLKKAFDAPPAPPIFAEQPAGNIFNFDAIWNFEEKAQQ